MAADDRELVADVVGDAPSVPVGAPMPDLEPGHKGEELNPGGVFDPNAALRNQEGRGPGLQDSEILAPAHWVQVAPEALLDPQAQLDALKRERESYERSTDEKFTDRIAQVDEQISHYQALVDQQNRDDGPQRVDPTSTRARRQSAPQEGQGDQS